MISPTPEEIALAVTELERRKSDTNVKVVRWLKDGISVKDIVVNLAASVAASSHLSTIESV